MGSNAEHRLRSKKGFNVSSSEYRGRNKEKGQSKLPGNRKKIWGANINKKMTQEERNKRK